MKQKTKRKSPWQRRIERETQEFQEFSQWEMDTDFIIGSEAYFTSDGVVHFR